MDEDDELEIIEGVQEVEAECLQRGRGYRFTPAQRIEIIRRHKNGIGKKRIARELNISLSSVLRWVRRYRDERNLKPHVNSAGRDRTTDANADFLLACSGNQAQYLLNELYKNSLFF